MSEPSKSSASNRFWAAFGMVVGLLIALLCGSCTLWSFKGMGGAAMISVPIGGACTAFGVWVFREGLLKFRESFGRDGDGERG